MRKTKNNPVIEAALQDLPECERAGAAKVLERLYGNQEASLDEASVVLAEIADEGLIELAGNMIRASYRQHKATRELHLAEKRQELSRAEFWMAVNQRYGLDEEGRHFFDPNTITIREAARQPRATPRSLDKTAEKYAEHVEEVLENPLAAAMLSHDEGVPGWLRSLALAVTEPGLRPGLRKAVEESLADPAVACQWRDTATEDGMPDWMASMFGVLALRKKRSV